MIRAAVAVVSVAIALACGASSASAVMPWWHVDLGSRPASIPVGGEGELVLTVENVGDAPALGTITVTDVLPAGLQALAIAGSEPKHGGALGETEALACSLEHLNCKVLAAVEPYDAIEVRIQVQALPGAAKGEQSAVTVSGGGAPSVHVARPLGVGGLGGFDLEGYGLASEAQGGAPATQAGAHPFQVTGSIMLDQGADAAALASPPDAGPAVPARDVIARLPPGLIANPAAVPRCLSWQFTAGVEHDEQDECPYESAVGVASVTFDQGGGSGTRTLAAPLFNIEPEPGEPARFGFYVPIEGIPIMLTTSLRSGSGEDWGVNLSGTEIPQDSGISSVRVTFWGVPGESVHDSARGWGCLAETRGVQAHEACLHFEESSPPAFVTLPRSCTASLASSVEGDSWSAPGAFASFPASEPLQAFRGCSHVGFSPTIATVPTTRSASSPSGFAFNLSFDTEGLTSGSGIAQSDLENTVVTLPEGLTLDPSAGVGLGACSQAQFAEATLDSPPGAGCPEDSKLGTVEIETPLLFTTIYGTLYVATPYANPFSEPGHPDGSLIALYVIASSRAQRGILVKLAGKVTPDPTTGQLTVSFEGSPPLPFAHFNFHFKEGAQAPLITPATCGTYTTTAQLTPYSAPENALTETASFQVTSGSEGAPCPSGTPPFAPSIQAGTLTNHAGTFSPLYVGLSRTDAMQYISSFSTVLPLGLTANLTGVPQCPQADVAVARTKPGTVEEQSPSCPEASLIGHSLVGTGVGSVLDYVPGKLYLAGPFHGDPLSVVSITSAVVGPFDLGTVVVQFALHIDPHTAQVSIDPSGSEPIPTIIDGIVTHVRDIKVSIDRPNFTINPTACQAHPIASTLTSSLGQSATTSTPLHAEACNELAFKPAFTASTNGKTSRQKGASLTVKLKMPIKLGTQSNIKSVKVDLPKQLPARLTTLQKACTAKQFDANPAGCPPESVIGHAKALTPLIPVPLEGPAYFVSNGGEAFPNLIMVLQGYGITIDLVGDTFISNAGVTSSTFKAVPDQPVGSFELTLPEGKFSALAANGNLCKAKLKMPTELIAQNGAKIKQTTPVSATGCARKKALTRSQKLAIALKACHKQPKGAKRKACERRARKQFGPVKKAKKSKKK
jgi:uncharacterized repeat protein (TIGR01451 family)